MTTVEALQDRNELSDRSFEHRLAVVIRRERLKKKKTQEQVARALGTYQALITRIENGRRGVSLGEYVRMATVIGFDPVAGLRRALKSSD